MSIGHRCEAAHPDDPTACEGPPDAVKVIDQYGTAAQASVQHGTRLCASLIGPRVRPGSVLVPGAALTAYHRAQRTAPFVWQHDGNGGAR